jgi:hypothetical protein
MASKRRSRSVVEKSSSPADVLRDECLEGGGVMIDVSALELNESIE